MIVGFLIFCLVCGMWAEARGNRTPRALLASVAVSCGLTLANAPFDFVLWVTIDVCVIVAIERFGKVGTAERAIFALFPPAWVLYHIQPDGWREAVTLIVALQFLLTLPWDRLGQVVWRTA